MGNISESYSLDAVKHQLGAEEAIDMFEYALPRIDDRKNELLVGIVDKNWEAVGNSAHRIISSVRLYGTQKLERILRAIQLSAKAGDVPSALKLGMLQEFEFVKARLKQWIATEKR